MTEFESKAKIVLGSLQQAIASVISDFGDPTVIRPVDLSETLGIDMNLAWKMCRLVNSTDLFSIGKYLPGRKAIASFCRRAALLEGDEKKISNLKQASTNLELLIKTYAGSRKELELMLANLSVDERTGNDIIHRRKSFEGNRYTFGIQSDVQLSTIILMAAKSGKKLMDLCRIKGHIGLFLTRPNVPWRVASTNIMDSEGNIKTLPGRLPLFPQVKGEPPLIRKFCSKSLPHFGISTTRSGRTNYFLEAEEMGITSSINLFTAEVLRDTGRLYKECPEDGAALNNSSRTPTKRIVIEVYIPNHFGSTPIEVEMWSRLFGSDDMSEMIPGDLLPINEQPVLYKPGKRIVPVPGIPEYSKLMKSCFKELEKDPKDFRLVRMTMDFPPIPASIDILMGLPEKPS